MKISLKLGVALAAIALGSGAQAAAIIGEINFSSGPNGGVILQDLAGNATTNIAAAVGVKEWLVPQVDSRTESFLSIPNGQSVSATQPWLFTPSAPLWTVVGFGNFTFNLSSVAVTVQDTSILLIRGNGTISSTTPGLDPTPATWLFTTQGFATEGKFSWSATTRAVPEVGTPLLFGAALLGMTFVRRRKLN